ncbi:MAG: 50S ribosomal protein L22 [Deltaproteobacteria bacterium RIFCSPHIGHO2_12_FULL_43_9]|nr:MAG: 50S ribosomal protein L22 [Deltaproteobacteria bacterium RIFCSPHIGHO2_12_FULL_43_9]
MEACAKTRYLQISPRRMRLVADLVRGKMVNNAIEILRFTNKKGARLISKSIKSAVANAEQTKQIDIDTLYIKRIMVDGGPLIKRWLPRAMGRANRVLKHTSHLTVVLEEK